MCSRYDKIRLGKRVYKKGDIITLFWFVSKKLKPLIIKKQKIYKLLGQDCMIHGWSKIYFGLSNPIYQLTLVSLNVHGT